MNYLLDSIGRLRIAQNRLDEGVAYLRECGRRLEAWGTSNPGFVPWRTNMAPALAASGARDEALQLGEDEIELGRAVEVPRELGMALRAAALVEGGDRGIALLHEAVAVLEGSEGRLEDARALTDLGAALRRGGGRGPPPPPAPPRHPGWRAAQGRAGHGAVVRRHGAGGAGAQRAGGERG